MGYPVYIYIYIYTVTWRSRCRGSASLRRHKARFRVRKAGRELGARSESPGGQLGLEYCGLIFVIFFVLCKCGHLAARSRTRSNRRGILDPSRAPNRTGKGAGWVPGRDSTVLFFVIYARTSDAKDQQVSLWRPRGEKCQGHLPFDSFGRMGANCRPLEGPRRLPARDDGRQRTPGISLRTKDFIRTALGQCGARKNPATYADEVAGRSLVAAKRTDLAHPLSGARPSIPHRSGFGSSSVLSVRPTSSQISRPESNRPVFERAGRP